MPKISNGGKTYEFTIRKGLKYSDGSPVKASDWEHTVKRVFIQESGGSGFFSGIEGAEAYAEAGKEKGDIKGIVTDDESGKVTINLLEPDGTFLNVLATNFAGIVPSDTSFEVLTKDPPPGVGPYMYTKSVPNREFVMEKNKNFDIPDIPKGNVDTITTKIIKSQERVTQDVINGQLDYSHDPPPADLLPEVQEHEQGPLSRVHGRGHPLLLDEHAGRAVRQREGSPGRQLSRSTSARFRGSTAGCCEPTCNFIPPDHAGLREDRSLPVG